MLDDVKDFWSKFILPVVHDASVKVPFNDQIVLGKKQPKHSNHFLKMGLVCFGEKHFGQKPDLATAWI